MKFLVVVILTLNRSLSLAKMIPFARHQTLTSLIYKQQIIASIRLQNEKR